MNNVRGYGGWDNSCAVYMEGVKCCSLSRGQMDSMDQNEKHFHLPEINP